jgi:flagellar biosynthesis anti-sigma factor FlgM
MKIEGNYKNNLNVEFQNSKSLSALKSNVSKAVDDDDQQSNDSNVVLSSAAKSILSGEKKEEEINTQKVTAIKSSILSGQYSISAEKIADGMLKEFKI